MHDVFQVVAGHLAVADQDPGLGDEFLEPLFHGLDALDAVVEKEDLAVAFQFAADRVADDPLIIGAHRGVDRDAVGRGGVDGRHVAHAHERKVEGSRDGGGGEGENIDLPETFLELLLVLDAEALLLVDHGQTEILE